MDTADIERYIKYLDGGNPHTAKRYKLTIKKLREFAKTDGDIDVEMANEFINSTKREVRDKRIPTRSTLVNAYAVIGLFKYVGRKDWRDIRVPTGVVIRDNPPFLYEEDIAELIKHSKGVLKPAIALSYDLALRFGECAMLERSDFNYNTLKCKVIRLKQINPTEQVLNVNKDIADVVKEYLSKRRDKKPELFVTDSHHTPLSINQQKLFPQTCKSLNIEDRAESGKPPTWHILRHTRLTWMIAGGKSVEEAAKFAGHRSTASTLKYLNLCTFYGLGKYKVLKAE